MYEIYDPCTIMFFFRNKHMMIDLGTGNNNKITWAVVDEQEMIDIIEVRIDAASLQFASAHQSATHWSRH